MAVKLSPLQAIASSLDCFRQQKKAARRCRRAAFTLLFSGRYLQTGSPSPAEVTMGFVVLTPMPQEKLAICECVIVADQ